MRVPKEKAAENRAALLDAASRLFRQRGIDGVGVAEVAKEAGLTHGALYAHFPSKDALAAAAFEHGFTTNLAAISPAGDGAAPTLQSVLDQLLSKNARDRVETGCPMTASASEAFRQSAAVSTRFADAFEVIVGMVQETLADTLTATSARQLAVATVAAEIGAIAVSRAVMKADDALAEEVLVSTRKMIMNASSAP